MACFVHYLLDLPNLAPERITDICAGLADPDAGAQAVQATEVLNHSIDYSNRASRLMNRRQLSELDSSLVRLTWKVARSLLTGTQKLNTIVYVEARLKDHPLFDVEELYDQVPTAKERLRFWHPEFVHSSPHQIDFVVTLGGDGTVLHTSNLFQGIVPPVLSFSLGSLGFLTKFKFNEYESTLHRVFNDGIIVSLRLRFECTVMRSRPLPEDEQQKGEWRDLKDELIGSKKDLHTHEATEVHQILNDVVVDRGPHPTMSTTEVFGDDEYFTSVQADGICIATPTGSTAYSLAAGGSLCHPENPVILLTAICAHTLNFRPLILPDSILLHVGVPYNARTSSWASFDGRSRTEIQPGDYVSISASRYPFASVLPSGNRSREWIKSISSTLQWNERRRQRPFDAEKDLDEAYERERKSSRTSDLCD
ncbi:NAD+ kinase [Ascosphaera apis ARSEF 7405]|uniref:NAD+ kinase n=1 Tax=Ascosphaera apis ARSEF 7405 TaxID=392613 RepID=A0A168B0E2_9EURO|nr:NAD+ kinase [Ascosphaera apis ARSEF 7405]